MNPRAIELLEQFAMQQFGIICAGRSGPARWECEGCRNKGDYRAERMGFLKNPPQHLRRIGREFGPYERQKAEAWALVKHADGCEVAEAMRIVQEARHSAEWDRVEAILKEA